MGKHVLLTTTIAMVMASCATPRVTEDKARNDGYHSFTASHRTLQVGEKKYAFSLSVRENTARPEAGREWFLLLGSDGYMAETTGLHMTFGNGTSCYLPALARHSSEKAQGDMEPQDAISGRFRYTAVYIMEKDILDRVERYGIRTVRIRSDKGTVEGVGYMNGLSLYITEARESLMKRIHK